MFYAENLAHVASYSENTVTVLAIALQALVDIEVQAICSSNIDNVEYPQNVIRRGPIL